MRLFDLHCDTLYECWRKGESLDNNTCVLSVNRRAVYSPWYQVFAVWLPDTVRGEQAWRLCREAVSLAHRQTSVCWAHQQRVFDDRVVGILGVEGGGALAEEPQCISVLFDLGVRVITLTWNGSNAWGNGCRSTDQGGLTLLGKQAVREMETYGILPDVSHLNAAGFWDVVEITHRPFIASHSVSAAVHEHPRNLTDDQFDVIRDRGGLVGLTLCAEQLGEQSLDCLYRHLSHYWERGGEYTVACGFDLDGTAVPPQWQGMDVVQLFREYLLRHRVDEKRIDCLFFANAYRFFQGFTAIPPLQIHENEVQ